MKTGKYYQVLWRWSEALSLMGQVPTGGYGAHATSLNPGDRMLVTAFAKNELYLLGALEVETVGTKYANGKSLFGPFQILPLKNLKWALRFDSDDAPRLNKNKGLLWQVRSRRKLTDDSVRLLMALLYTGVKLPDYVAQQCFGRLRGHPKPANEGRLKTGQRE